MASDTASQLSSSAETRAKAGQPRRRRWRWIAALVLLLLLIGGTIARLTMPYYVRWYVIRTIDRNPLYQGSIGAVSINLWRGRYSINDIKLLKTTSDIPVPFFSADRMDLAIDWESLMHRRVKGRVFIERPQVNFVDDQDQSKSQFGGDGPWLSIIRDLFPFEINRAAVRNGAVHLRAFNRTPQVDVFLSDVTIDVSNLTNIRDETKPLISTVSVQGTAMNSGSLDCQIELDPFSYRPTFDLSLKLIGLDVARTNSLTRAYGKFDFEHGWFDLVMQLSSRQGLVGGYVKPLFRDLAIFGPQDLRKNLPQIFWEALVGGAEFVLKNQPRDQFGTYIPVAGSLDAPQPDILATLGNVLRNAFIRAYLPRLEPSNAANDGFLSFQPGMATEPDAPGPVNGGK